MSYRLFPMTGLTILFLVVLRIAIGWHFFNEGRDHYFDKKWSSQGFLKVAVGPFAEQAKSTLPNHHQWDDLVGRAFTDKEYTAANDWYNDKLAPGATKSPSQLAAEKLKATLEKPPAIDQVGYLNDDQPMYVNPIYGEWAKRVRADWRATVSEAERHYGFTEEQKAKGQEQLQRHLELLAGKLDNIEKELFEYRAELRRYEKMSAEPGTHDIPYEKDRLAAKKKELSVKPNAWISDLMVVESWLRDSLNGIAGSESVAINPLSEPVPTYKKIDRVVVWVLIIAGGCLILGLFTRLAALTCGLFLLSVVLTQPFWVADALKTTYYEWVELIACFMLATTGIGRYGGLDYFVHALFGRKSDTEIVVTEKTTRPVVVKRA